MGKIVYRGSPPKKPKKLKRYTVTPANQTGSASSFQDYNTLFLAKWWAEYMSSLDKKSWVVVDREAKQ